MNRWITARRRALMNAARGIDVAALAISYTGTYQDYGVVQMTGGQYRLLSFTSSGTLAIDEPVACEACVVGGGANGVNGRGGGGAYLKNQIINDFIGGEVIVGAAQGVSSIGGVSVNAVSGVSGGTGGGGHSFNFGAGSGDGLSKYPFGDDGFEIWMNKPHCAGGAGGGISSRNGDYTGGNGGTNGGSGANATERSDGGTPLGGTGGVHGGGNGGRGFSTVNSGSNATYYGSGGGGYGNGNGITGSAGSGYQGIVYLRIPVEQ